MFIVFAKRQFVHSSSTCAHGGGNDCRRHVESICHKDYESLKKSQPSGLKFPEAKRGEDQQDIIRAEAMMCDLLVIKTYYNPWICLCF